MKAFLTPRDLAAAIGVSESSLKRWTDEGLLAASRTAGGHRRIARSEAIRFIRDARVPIVRPELLGFEGVHAIAPTGGGAPGEALSELFLRDDQAAARSLLLSSYLGGTGLAAACDGLVAAALERLGDLWKHDVGGILIEHRAVDTCFQTLSMIRATIPAPAPGAPVALGGAIGGDPYVLPTLCAAMVLAETGFRDVNLGPDVPLPVLARAIEQYRPDLVWRTLSATTTAAAETTRREIGVIEEQLKPTGSHLVVGGLGSSGLSGASRERVHVLGSMSELAGFARGLLASRRPARVPAGKPGEGTVVKS